MSIPLSSTSGEHTNPFKISEKDAHLSKKESVAGCWIGSSHGNLDPGYTDDIADELQTNQEEVHPPLSGRGIAPWRSDLFRFQPERDAGGMATISNM